MGPFPSAILDDDANYDGHRDPSKAEAILFTTTTPTTTTTTTAAAAAAAAATAITTTTTTTTTATTFSAIEDIDDFQDRADEDNRFDSDTEEQSLHLQNRVYKKLEEVKDVERQVSTK